MCAQTKHIILKIKGLTTNSKISMKYILAYVIAFLLFNSSLFKYSKGFIVTISSFLQSLAYPSKINSGKDIPIIINNYNRLTTMLKLIEALVSRGYNNIYIIDNKSTYPPLLEYYKICPYTVFRLEKNIGFKALWMCPELKKKFCRDYYIYTDSDVVPADYCLNNFIDYLFAEIKKRPLTRKIGLSLRIDNLPDFFAQKEEVIEWEEQFYTKLNKHNLYRAPIDTTFALYRPFTGLSRSRYVKTYRTAYPYQAEHLPWYNNTNDLSAEEMYYVNHVKQITEWTIKLQEQYA